MKFYISDLHLGHERAILFDNRPFANLEEMNNVIISNWNNVVTNNEDVYILGDFAWKNEVGLEIIDQLNGRKHLIKGNHDHISPQLAKKFVSVKDYDVIKDGSKNQFHVVLSHFPIAHWINADYGYIHLYGHVHQGRDSQPFEKYVRMMQEREQPYFCYNVGCMLPLMNYTPRTIYEITGLNEKSLSVLTVHKSQNKR